MDSCCPSLDIQQGSEQTHTQKKTMTSFTLLICMATLKLSQ